MIQKANLQNLSALGNASSKPDIGLAWGGIAGWMVVDENETVRGMTDRRLKDFTGMRKTFIQSSSGDFRNSNQPATGIEQNRSKGFAV